MNAVDTDVSSNIYESVIWDGKRLTGKAAAERLLANQLDGIEKCIVLGMLVKVNIVLIPGINDKHIPDLVNAVRKMGVFIVNILPLIPVEGTKFSDMRAPTPEERKKLMDVCSKDVKMMRHCRQCRADAIGLLDKDRSNEFIRVGACGSGCGPVNVRGDGVVNDAIRVAVASDNGAEVNGGFGNTRSFRMYTVNGGDVAYDGAVDIKEHGGVYGDAHTKNIADRIISLKDADIVVVKEIGPRPMSELKRSGKYVHVAGGSVTDTVHDAVKAYKGQR
jgi:nitrogen fixation protein NifB